MLQNVTAITKMIPPTVLLQMVTHKDESFLSHIKAVTSEYKLNYWIMITLHILRQSPTKPVTNFP